MIAFETKIRDPKIRLINTVIIQQVQPLIGLLWYKQSLWLMADAYIYVYIEYYWRRILHSFQVKGDKGDQGEPVSESKIHFY